MADILPNSLGNWWEDRRKEWRKLIFAQEVAFQLTSLGFPAAKDCLAAQFIPEPSCLLSISNRT